MVYSSPVLWAALREFSKKKKLRGSFLDQMYVHLRAGTGGMGNPKYGGIGGKGGDIYFKGSAAEDLKSVLRNFPDKRIKASHGGNSISRQLLGSRGDDVIVDVPCGLRIVSEHKHLIGELNAVGETLLVAKGGVGGCPSTNFSGMKGQSFSATLELSLIADVGLVGFPNAGKSTLLKACSNARPRIANYPFTTVKPNLGILQYPDFRTISMADLPGLIEGAHANYGMGHKFLRHAERTKLILMLVDISGFQLRSDRPKRSVLETVLLLNKELELYNEDLLEKPISLVVNKMDLPDADKSFEELKEKLDQIHDILDQFPDFMRPRRVIKFEDIIPISALHGKEEVVKVRTHVRDSLDSLAEKEWQRNEGMNIKEKINRLQAGIKESGPSLI